MTYCWWRHEWVYRRLFIAGMINAAHLKKSLDVSAAVQLAGNWRQRMTSQRRVPVRKKDSRTFHSDGQITITNEIRLIVAIRFESQRFDVKHCHLICGCDFYIKEIISGLCRKSQITVIYLALSLLTKRCRSMWYHPTVEFCYKLQQWSIIDFIAIDGFGDLEYLLWLWLIKVLKRSDIFGFQGHEICSNFEYVVVGLLVPNFWNENKIQH